MQLPLPLYVELFLKINLSYLKELGVLWIQDYIFYYLFIQYLITIKIIKKEWSRKNVILVTYLISHDYFSCTMKIILFYFLYCFSYEYYFLLTYLISHDYFSCTIKIILFYFLYCFCYEYYFVLTKGFS